MKKAGFTLIELMVVIVIVGILFAVALPAFENVGKKDTRTAAQQVVNVLRLARQHAISRRQWTLVVFPNQDSDYTDYAKDINNVGKCLRSYAVLAATNSLDGQGSWSDSGWGKGGSWRDPSTDAMDLEFVTEWKTLPEGIYFDDEQSKGDYLFGGNREGYSGSFYFPWDPADPDSRDTPMSAILFKPNGRVYNMYDGNSSKGNFWQDNEGARIYVTSSKHYSPSGGKLGSSHEVPGGTNTVIQLQNKTGQIKILDLY